jgi:hypothetical protein
MDGDGAADAAVWSASSGWLVGVSDRSGAFGTPHVHVFTVGCLAGSADCMARAVSEELLWYITVTNKAWTLKSFRRHPALLHVCFCIENR